MGILDDFSMLEGARGHCFPASLRGLLWGVLSEMFCARRLVGCLVRT